MADPILVTIQDRVDILLSALTEIREVKTFPNMPTDRSTVEYPFTTTWFDFENWEHRNQYENETVVLNIITLLKAEDTEENLQKNALILMGVIHKAIFTDTVLRQYVQEIEKISPDIEYDSTTEATLTQQFRIMYLYKYGDMTTQDITI